MVRETEARYLPEYMALKEKLEKLKLERKNRDTERTNTESEGAVGNLPSEGAIGNLPSEGAVGNLPS